jgi:glycosyltransferase 2 family protein
MNWKRFKPWIRPVASVLLMGAIFGWMIHKIAIHWAEVRDRAGLVSKPNFVIASFLFALFLFVFRSLVWRRIIKRFGYRIPLAPAVRIWSSSELARYIPGVIWQVAGRVYLVKPYGVPGSVCAASQVLELVIFLLANILLGFGCLVVFGLRHIHGDARIWMYVLALLVPLLASLLHPKIFYGLMNRVMQRLKKPPLTSKLSGAELSRLLLWNILGLLVQSAAVFLIVARPLELQWAKWYVVTGAYCLAWCAGFLAVLNPGGLGVREAVFVAIMQFALPAEVRHHFSKPAVLTGFLTFLSGLLRLWTIAGELILTGFAHLFDHRGALGRIPAISNATQSRLSDPAGQI